MLKTIYTITSEHRNTLTFEFDINGNLITYKYEGDPMTEKFFEWIWKSGRFPTRETGMVRYFKDTRLDVQKGEPDLSFTAFWEAYKMKRKKIDAEYLWNKLSRDQKIAAIVGIRRYEHWLKLHSSYAKQLPDTYLRKRTWEDDNETND